MYASGPAAWARDVANTPGNEGTPTYLAERAREIAAESGMKLTVLERAAPGVPVPRRHCPHTPGALVASLH